MPRRGWASPRASTRGSPVTWLHVASSSAITRCGPNDEPSASGLEALTHFAAGRSSSSSAGGSAPPRPPPADLDHRGDRPPRARSREALGGRVRHAPPADRRAPAIRRGAPRAPPGTTRVVVAAMRPQLCRVGGAVADGVLLNWMLPARKRRARRWVQEGAEEARRTTPLVASRSCCVDGLVAAAPRRGELHRTINGSHRRHSEAMDVPLGSVGVAGPGRQEAGKLLEGYQSVLDLAIARVLADHDATALAEVADAAQRRRAIGSQRCWGRSRGTEAHVCRAWP